MEILKVNNLKKYYGCNNNITKALNNISFTVDDNEFLAIMGSSGSGKTSLLNTIATIDTVTSGNIIINGIDITNLNEDELSNFRKDNLGFVFQDFNLLDTLTIRENIALSLIINKEDKNKIDKLVDDISKKLGIEEILEKYPYEISKLVEKMLFYAKSEVLEKDYFIKETSLTDLVHPVILEYKNYLLTYHIKVEVSNMEDLIVYTDIKWLDFIISQLISNAIKYQNKKDKLIKISGHQTATNIRLEIYDNGVGIKEEDLSRVFAKGFTGSNRNKSNASGLGLYLTKKLCDKLGLDIKIESEYLKYTKVTIIFPKGNYFVNGTKDLK
ncbi:MAG TPA: ATP-binding cassette domain-containing protein [Candidatus Onthousia faecavium]|nr:ATP-binding cassette domain-containing protein [Candidatus Onthousia faecavium]